MYLLLLYLDTILSCILILMMARVLRVSQAAASEARHSEGQRHSSSSSSSPAGEAYLLLLHVVIVVLIEPFFGRNELILKSVPDSA